MKIGYLFVLALFFTSEIGLAKTVTFGENPVWVSVPYGEHTIFRFPSPVATVSKAKRYQIEPANSEKPDYSVLSIKPRFTTANDSVVFLLSDGSAIKVRLTVENRGANSDGFVDFQADQTNLAQGVQEKEKRITEMDLLRGMVRNHQVRGFKVDTVAKPIIKNEKGLSIELEEVYRGKELTGYVYRLINKSQTESYKVDVRQLKIGDKNRAVISSVERPVLSPVNNESYLWVVAKTGKSSEQLRLPTDTVTTQTKGGKS